MYPEESEKSRERRGSLPYEEGLSALRRTEDSGRYSFGLQILEQSRSRVSMHILVGSRG